MIVGQGMIVPKAPHAETWANLSYMVWGVGRLSSELCAKAKKMNSHLWTQLQEGAEEQSVFVLALAGEAGLGTSK